MIASNIHSGITCEQAEQWFFFYFTDGSETAREQEELLVDHLRTCSVCARLYKEIFLIVILIREYYAADQEPTDISNESNRYFKTVDEVWEDFKRREPDFIDDSEFRRIRRWLR